MAKEPCNNCGTVKWQVARAMTSCDYCGGKPSAAALELLDALESFTDPDRSDCLDPKMVARKWRATFGVTAPREGASE